MASSTKPTPYTPLNIVFRADASVEVGTGHIVRCATLALALKQQGHKVTFFCYNHPGHMIKWLTQQGLTVIPLSDDWAETAPEPMIGILKTFPQKPDWLIVDHYKLDATWEKSLRPLVHQIMVIDDLADRPHHCDALLDQNHHTHPEKRYEGLVPAHCQGLFGPNYALLRPSFFELRQQQCQEPHPNTADQQKLLVFMGGSDPDNVTSLVLNALALLDVSKLHIDVVIGASNQHGESIQALISSQPSLLQAVKLHQNTPHMPQLMAESDLCIGAGGTTTWERCCLGLPTLVITIADNQLALTESMAQEGAVQSLGFFSELEPTMIAKAVQTLLEDPQQIATMKQTAQKWVDGLGVHRVLHMLNNEQLILSILSDEGSWIQPYLANWIATLQEQGHHVHWGHSADALQPGEMAFFLSCGQIIPPEKLALNRHNLVVHESALPQGKGWSPLTWQVLEGKNDIPITLFEAAESVDSGVIYKEEIIKLTGTELVDELRQKQWAATQQLCTWFINTYPNCLKEAKPQVGESSFYPRRRPEDSQLDPTKPLAEQFNLLRVVDNDRYPAFFEWQGQRYTVKVTQHD